MVIIVITSAVYWYYKGIFWEREKIIFHILIQNKQ